MADSRQVYVIAEAGVNHNGSMKMARKLIDVAAASGADAVKFQTFKTEMSICISAPKAEYQKRNTGSDESQYEMVRRLELNIEMHRELIEYCREKNIQFLSTPFDEDSVQLLVGTFDLPCIKIPSGEITNPLLLLSVAHTGKPIIMSTGMSTLGEIEEALGVLAFGYTAAAECQPSLKAFREAFYSDSGQEALKSKVTLLHCTTEYPAPFNEVNLKSMDTLHAAFGLAVGYSDHTQGISVPLAAVALGAVIIEKHFTLDRNLPGPDHKASLEPEELKSMIIGIRQIESALGSKAKLPTQSEVQNREIARKSLVAKVDIQSGTALSDANLTAKRPGNGISPMNLWQITGLTAMKDIKRDEVISRDCFVNKPEIVLQ